MLYKSKNIFGSLMLLETSQANQHVNKESYENFLMLTKSNIYNKNVVVGFIIWDTNGSPLTSDAKNCSLNWVLQAESLVLIVGLQAGMLF